MDAERKGLVYSHKSGQLPGLLAEAFVEIPLKPILLAYPYFLPLSLTDVDPHNTPHKLPAYSFVSVCPAEEQQGIKSNTAFINSYKYLVSVYHKLALILVLRI